MVEFYRFLKLHVMDSDAALGAFGLRVDILLKSYFALTHELIMRIVDTVEGCHLGFAVHLK